MTFRQNKIRILFAPENSIYTAVNTSLPGPFSYTHLSSSFDFTFLTPVVHA